MSMTRFAANVGGDPRLRSQSPQFPVGSGKSDRFQLQRRTRVHSEIRGCLAVCLVLGLAVGAQELVVPSDVPASPNALARLLTDEMIDGLFKIGPFQAYPRVGLSLYYDDNINGTATNRVEDVVLTLSPGISARAVSDRSEAEKEIVLDYTPVIRFYFDSDEPDDVDHAARIRGSWEMHRLRLRFNQSFLISSEPTTDVGGRTDRFISSTLLQSDYQLGFKTSVSVNAGLRWVDNDELTSSRNWFNTDYINYQLNSRLNVGAGLILGYVDVDGDSAQTGGRNPDQTYQQLRLRAQYRVPRTVADGSSITKVRQIDISASAGAEVRQYRGGVSDTFTPVWDIEMVYMPFETTTLALGFSQRYYSAALVDNQNYLLTSANLAVSQRILGRFFLGLGGGYGRSDYESTIEGFSTDRTDEVVMGRASLNTFIMPNWAIGVYYFYEQDISNESEFSTRRNRVGIETNWSF